MEVDSKNVNLSITNIINPSLIKELRLLRIDLSIFWGLTLSLEGKYEMLLNQPHIVQSLERKGWIEKDGKPTVFGKDIYNQLCISNNTNKEVDIKKKVQENFSSKLEGFEEWWNIYPTTNTFIAPNGNKFSGTQVKRVKKDACQDVWLTLVNKDFTAQDIIKSTEYHFNIVKSISGKTGKNELTFIPNSLRYLRERVFEPFINKESFGGTTFTEIELGV